MGALPPLSSACRQLPSIFSSLHPPRFVMPKQNPPAASCFGFVTRISPRLGAKKVLLILKYFAEFSVKKRRKRNRLHCIYLANIHRTYHRSVWGPLKHVIPHNNAILVMLYFLLFDTLLQDMSSKNYQGRKIINTSG